jgi:hypothetical protein
MSSRLTPLSEWLIAELRARAQEYRDMAAAAAKEKSAVSD